MLIYDKAYIEIRNKYILPLTEYTVQYKSLRKNNIKEILVSKFISVTEKDNKALMFSFETDVLYKGLLGDIQMFYLRYLLQRRDVIEIEPLSLSPNWNIVTHYYEAFFAASLLLRLLHRGNIFLDGKVKRELERLVGCNLGYAVALDSNQFYEIVQENGKEYLKMQKGNSNTHELVWEKMDQIIDEMLLLSRTNSSEKILLSSIKKINSRLSKTYPSQIRNRVNYQPQYGLETLERKIYSVNPNMYWVEFLLKNDAISWNDENSVVNALFCYKQYITQLCSNLIAEYFTIKGNSNGVLKKYNEYTGENQQMKCVIYNIEPNRD